MCLFRCRERAAGRRQQQSNCRGFFGRFYGLLLLPYGRGREAGKKRQRGRQQGAGRGLQTECSRQPPKRRRQAGTGRRFVLK